MRPKGIAKFACTTCACPPLRCWAIGGKGFAMAQARLGPGRCTTACAPLASASWPCNWRQNARWNATPLASRCLNKANVQEWLADSRIEIDQARWLVLRRLAADQGTPPSHGRCARKWLPSKWWPRGCSSAWWDRAMQIFGAMGLARHALAAFWTWGRALRLMDGPDEVHLRTVARQVLAQARAGLGSHTAYFTTPSSWRPRRICRLDESWAELGQPGAARRAAKNSA